MAEKRPPEFIVVPRDTPATVCKGHKKPGGSCEATLYYVERPRKGKPGTARLPIHCDVPGGSAPDSLSEGRGILHFMDCPDADKF